MHACALKKKSRKAENKKDKEKELRGNAWSHLYA